MKLYEPGKCRAISEDSIPPFGAPTAITYLPDCETIMIPGGRRSKQDALYLLQVAIPALIAGECKILITWIGEWRTDIFEVTEETAPIYEKALWESCRSRGWL